MALGQPNFAFGLDALLCLELLLLRFPAETDGWVSYHFLPGTAGTESSRFGIEGRHRPEDGGQKDLQKGGRQDRTRLQAAEMRIHVHIFRRPVSLR